MRDKMNFAPFSTKIRPAVSPSKSYKLTNDAVCRVVVNGGGGMGGSRVELFGTNCGKDENGFIQLHLNHSDRAISVNPRFISEIETVKLWQEVQHHENENFPSPRVRYFCTHLDEELEMSEDPHEVGYDRLEDVFELIQPDRC